MRDEKYNEVPKLEKESGLAAIRNKIDMLNSQVEDIDKIFRSRLHLLLRLSAQKDAAFEEPVFQYCEYACGAMRDLVKLEAGIDGLRALVHGIDI